MQRNNYVMMVFAWRWKSCKEGPREEGGLCFVHACEGKQPCKSALRRKNTLVSSAPGHGVDVMSKSHDQTCSWSDGSLGYPCSLHGKDSVAGMCQASHERKETASLHGELGSAGLAVEFAGLLVRRVLLGQLVLGPKMAPKTNKNRPKWASS